MAFPYAIRGRGHYVFVPPCYHLASIFSVTSWPMLAAGTPTIVCKMRAAKKKAEKRSLPVESTFFEQPSSKSHIYISLGDLGIGCTQLQGKWRPAKVQVLIIRMKERMNSGLVNSHWHKCFHLLHPIFNEYRNMMWNSSRTTKDD